MLGIAVAIQVADDESTPVPPAPTVAPVPPPEPILEPPPPTTIVVTPTPVPTETIPTVPPTTAPPNPAVPDATQILEGSGTAPPT